MSRTKEGGRRDEILWLSGTFARLPLLCTVLMNKYIKITFSPHLNIPLYSLAFSLSIFLVFLAYLHQLSSCNHHLPRRVY
jgi:hypothetical protein